jgi:large subunit ribosomal protein L13
LASQVASLIKGKHKVNFTPNTNCGDNIIIINASKILITGQKNKQKTYISHTGYPGGKINCFRRIEEKIS